MRERYKKSIASFLVIGTILPQLAVTAKKADESIKVSYNDIKLYIEDEKISLTDAEGNVVEPFIYEGTTYLPLRAVAETLSMEVGWDKDNYIVSLKSGADEKERKDIKYKPTKGEKDINISYRNISVLLDDNKLDLKSADGKTVEPFIYEGTTYLPLRAVAEATLTEVNWDGETNSIYLTKPEEEVKTESSYDLTKESDWTREEAQEYGYLLDFESQADKEYVQLLTYTGDEPDVLVPSKIDGKTVYIDAYNQEHKMFSGNTNIKYVSFEDGVVLANATTLFLGCTSLEAVFNILSQGGSISAFNGCKNLRYIDGDFPKTTSFNNMFSGCGKIKSVPNIGSSVIQAVSGFVNCKNLEGDIYCYSTKIAKADNAFKGTEKQINFYVPYPSTSYDTFKAADLPENVNLLKMENKVAYLPKVINVASFTTMDLYNYAVAPQFADCDFTWKCDVGTASEGKFSIAATEDNVGEYPISVTVSRDGEELYTAESVINIVSTKNLSKSMALVCIGDIYTMQKGWKTRIGRYTERIKFVGTRSSQHEGRNGANTSYYLNPFEYTADKNGVGTDNPFYNPQTQKFDWAYYKKDSGLSPSGIQFYFQNHTGKSAEENTANVRIMVDSVKESAPDSKIFIVLPAYIGSWNEAAILKNFDFVTSLGEEFANDENIYFIPLYLTYDKNTNVSKNKSLPNDEGYNQWGDCMYGAYSAALR